ncbi:energy transducer TonB [Sedimentitalea sp. JM2-8]|uniref:Energy transducer TonB n=1 Tax=Sedimentitalea xiamensis TaxID=3050037 RepID=A0ABT7FHX8_9RHOB|nr:energy transducer TonB [Sedimentitalea xiamensis]MDK3074697.1 energy transducer TonB [Sedimentitalea xiamensis]
MRAAVEIGFFLAVAAGVHVAVWQGADSGGAPGAGEGGDALISLQASSPSLEALVDRWQREPVVASSPAPMTPDPAIPPTPIRRTAPEQSVPRLTAIESLPMSASEPSAPVSVDRASHDYAFASPERSIRPPQRQPQPSPPRSALASPGQKAAGRGQRSQAGNNGASRSAAADSSQSPALMATWGQAIRAEIERRKSFPKGLRVEGSVTLAIAVHSNGTVSAVRIRKSSGHPALDQAAIAAVKRARIRSAPKGLATGVHQFVLPMSFQP